MNLLSILIAIVAVLLMVVILLQQRSTGLGGAFGGDLSVFSSRRGAEKSLFRLTIVLAIILFSLTLYSVHKQKAAIPPTVTSNTATNTQ